MRRAVSFVSCVTWALCMAVSFVSCVKRALCSAVLQLRVQWLTKLTCSLLTKLTCSLLMPALCTPYDQSVHCVHGLCEAGGPKLNTFSLLLHCPVKRALGSCPSLYLSLLGYSGSQSSHAAA